MSDFPSEWLTPAKLFLKTCSFHRSILCKSHILRNTKTVKIYLCIFVCFVTKAIYLEVAMEFSTEGFLDILTLFISRKGLSSDVYCDCGTNFMCTVSKLTHLIDTYLRLPQFKDKVTKFTAEQNVKFHFLPPAIPHQSGLWESAIKGAKHHLNQIIGEQKLILIDFFTLTTRVEAILNSRPLAPLLSDPFELNVLTLDHFLTGQVLVTLPEENRADVPQIV